MKNLCIGLLLLFGAHVAMAQNDDKCDQLDSFNIVTVDTLDFITIWWNINDPSLGYNLQFRKLGDTMWKCEITLDSFFTIQESSNCVEYEFSVSTICPFDTSAYLLDTIISFCPPDTMAPPPSFQSIATMYPNPVVDQLTINLSPDEIIPIRSISIVDLQGKTWLRQDQAFDQLMINTHDWPSGVYLVMVESETQTFVEKILKQ